MYDEKKIEDLSASEPKDCGLNDERVSESKPIMLCQSRSAPRQLGGAFRSARGCKDFKRTS